MSDRRAWFSEWSPELQAALEEPFPLDMMEMKATRKGGQPDTPFIPWWACVQRLNDLVGPGWTMRRPIVREVGAKLVMGTPITILGVTRCNFGHAPLALGDLKANAAGEMAARDYGSAETNAFAQAAKRTLSLFGVGAYLYDRRRRDAALAELRAWQHSRGQDIPLAHHEARLAYLKAVRAEVGDDVEVRIGSRTLLLKPGMRDAWQAIGETPALARMWVEAVERSTRRRFDVRDWTNGGGR